MSGVYPDSKAAQVGVETSLSFLIVANLIGNTLVILIILTNKSMKSPMNYLLVNLAVADIMVGVFLAPVFIFNHHFTHPDGLAGKLLCSTLTSGTIAWIAQISSCLFLVAISIERYFAIVHPYSVKYRLSVIKVKRMTIAFWICATIFNIPVFVVLDYDHRNGLCTDQWPESKPWLSKAYSFAWLICFGVIPIAIMFVLYSRVIHTLWFKKHQVQGTQLAILKARKRVTKMVVIVSVIYAVCISPNLLMYVINHFRQIQNDYVFISVIFSNILIVCNSTINPFIYTLQSATFRSHLKELICCIKTCKNRLDILTESSELPNEQDMPIRLHAFTSGPNRVNIH